MSGAKRRKARAPSRVAIPPLPRPKIPAQPIKKPPSWAAFLMHRVNRGGFATSPPQHPASEAGMAHALLHGRSQRASVLRQCRSPYPRAALFAAFSARFSFRVLVGFFLSSFFLSRPLPMALLLMLIG